MENRIKGIHHITAIAGNAKRNLDFYTGVLGLKLVKKTVNFDDPGTYHFYFADAEGNPGTVLTFFPWEGMMQGRRGTGMVTEIGYSVPPASFDFWIDRFQKHNVIYNKPAEKFGSRYLTFLDPDGLKFELIADGEDKRKPFESAGIRSENATRGFKSISITLESINGTGAVLTDIFGYELRAEHVNRYRFVTDAIDSANIVDLVEAKGEKRGHVAAGSVHHVAFRVSNEDVLMEFRQKVLAAGLDITEKIDRNYFYSLYFREPGGVLFEIATDNPGFAVDEAEGELGTHLKLPARYESRRSEIEQLLPKLD